MFKFSVITGKIIINIIQQTPGLVYEAVKSAYIDHESGNTINPTSLFLKFSDKPSSRIIALPAAFTHRNKISGIKWIGSNPDNVAHGFPRASAVIILNDYDTCYPIACLEGSIISSLRTANSAVLAAEELKIHYKKSNRLGIVGTGLISKQIFNVFLERSWSIDEIVLFDMDTQYANKFATYIKSMTNNKIKVTVARILNDVLKSSDLIILATTAAAPYIQDLSLFEHNPVVLNISLRDLSPDILINANNIVDDIEHVLQAETSPHLAFKIMGNRSFINGTIGGLIKEKFIIDKSKPTIFSPMGMGILDLAVAFQVYQHALIKGQCMQIDDFIYNEFAN